jgi:hypothetical protein
MPRIARGEENTTSKINWFTRVLGVLADMHLMEFQIWRIEEGLPGAGGVQVFPLAGWEDVSAAPGKFGVGEYFAYDNANARGWTPDLGAAIGTYRILWRWKQYDSSTYQEGAEDFELVVEVSAGPGETYIEVDDVRAEGLTNPPYTDAQIEASILTWQEFLDRACRQWFLPKELEFEFDGDGSYDAHFGVPIVSIEYLRINRSTSDLDPSLYKVYNDKKNPKIGLVQPAQLRDIHQAPYTYGETRFLKGYKNQAVKGVFGCVMPDGTPPKLIQRALLKLVIEKLTRPIYGPGSGDESSMTFAGVVIEERTDGHSIKYGTPTFQDRRVGLSGITQDLEILDIIRLYKAPLGFAATSYWSYL